jgi:hypothetical protein
VCSASPMCVCVRVIWKVGIGRVGDGEGGKGGGGGWNRFIH